MVGVCMYDIVHIGESMFNQPAMPPMPWEQVDFGSRPRACNESGMRASTCYWVLCQPQVHVQFAPGSIEVGDTYVNAGEPSWKTDAHPLAKCLFLNPCAHRARAFSP